MSNNDTTASTTAAAEPVAAAATAENELPTSSSTAPNGYAATTTTDNTQLAGSNASSDPAIDVNPLTNTITAASIPVADASTDENRAPAPPTTDDENITSSSSVTNEELILTPTSSEPSTPTATSERSMSDGGVTPPPEQEVVEGGDGGDGNGAVALQATDVVVVEERVVTADEAAGVAVEGTTEPVENDTTIPGANEAMEGQTAEQLQGAVEETEPVAVAVAEQIIQPIAADEITAPTATNEEGVQIPDPVPVANENVAAAVEENGAAVAQEAEVLAGDNNPAEPAGNQNENANENENENAAPAENVEGVPAVVAAAAENEAPVPGENGAAGADENNVAPPADNVAPPPAEGDPANQVQAENTEPAAPEEAPPAEPEPEPEPWFYDPEQPTRILEIPPEIVLHMFNFLPLSNMKDFSVCSKRCRALAIRRIYKHVNISPDAVKAFQKDGTLHHVADAVFGLVIRSRYLTRATELCEFIRKCMTTAEDEGLNVFKAVKRVKVSYGQVPYDRRSPVVQTGPLDSLSELDTRLIRAMFLSLRRVGFWKQVRWVDFVIKLWEDRRGLFDQELAEGEEYDPEKQSGFVSEEDGKFLEEVLVEGADDDIRDMAAVAPALKDVRLIHFKPRRRINYRRKVDIFEVLALVGGRPEKVILEYISAGESIDLVPVSKTDQTRVQRGVTELWANVASFDVTGFMEEMGRRFVDLKTFYLLVTAAGGESYLIPAKGIAAEWRKGVLEKLEKIPTLRTIMLPVRLGQEGENINYGRRKALGEVPKDTVERLSEIVIYLIENGADGLETIMFERKELEDEVDSVVGPGWVCRINWVNKRPKLEWTVEDRTLPVYY